MYSLIMTSLDGAWDKGGISLRLDRYLIYTSSDIAAELDPITPTVVEKLKAWPVLCTYELPPFEIDAPRYGRVGYLTDLQPRGSNLRIICEFDTSIPPISATQLKAILWELDIEKSETTTTHWAVKNVDLLTVLRKAGIVKNHPAEVSTPSLLITSDAVERALNDADALLQSGRGAASAMDRIHTSFHGYLLQACRSAGLSVDKAEEMRATALFRILREKHPALSYAGPRAGEIQSILRTASAIVDAVNTLRNNASIAHPAEALIPDPEAMLAINQIRSLLHYLEAKLSYGAKANDARPTIAIGSAPTSQMSGNN
jgi:hypothetical protein